MKIILPWERDVDRSGLSKSYATPNEEITVKVANEIKRFLEFSDMANSDWIMSKLNDIFSGTYDPPIVEKDDPDDWEWLTRVPDGSAVDGKFIDYYVHRLNRYLIKQDIHKEDELFPVSVRIVDISRYKLIEHVWKDPEHRELKSARSGVCKGILFSDAAREFMPEVTFPYDPSKAEKFVIVYDEEVDRCINVKYAVNTDTYQIHDINKTIVVDDLFHFPAGCFIQQAIFGKDNEKGYLNV